LRADASSNRSIMQSFWAQHHFEVMTSCVVCVQSLISDTKLGSILQLYVFICYKSTYDFVLRQNDADKEFYYFTSLV